MIKQTVNTVKHVAKGAALYARAQLLPHTPQSLARLSICKKCINNINGNCALCGCFVDEKTKYTGENHPHIEHCDKGLW